MREEFKKGMAFNPAHSPFSSSSIYYSSFSAFLNFKLKGNTEEIGKLNTYFSGRPINFLGQEQFFWVGRVTANRKFFMVGLDIQYLNRKHEVTYTRQLRSLSWSTKSKS